MRLWRRFFQENGIRVDIETGTMLPADRSEEHRDALWLWTGTHATQVRYVGRGVSRLTRRYREAADARAALEGDMPWACWPFSPGSASTSRSRSTNYDWLRSSAVRRRGRWDGRAGADRWRPGALQGPSRPVNLATIVHLEGKAYTADLDETERNELFVFSQVVAFGGLAAREFCSYGRYCNAADFNFVIQGFRDEPNGTFFDVRRRDGYRSVRVTADAYQVQAPSQMSFDRPIRIDIALIRALMSARGTPVWDRIFEAIGPFLRANTDSPEITEQTEVVEMVGAFEKALGVWSSDKLKREFRRHFRPTKDITPRDAPRIPPARRNGPSVRSFWIADFYELRNAHAHGSQAPPSGLVSDRVEHLDCSCLRVSAAGEISLERRGPLSTDRGRSEGDRPLRVACSVQDTSSRARRDRGASR